MRLSLAGAVENSVKRRNSWLAIFKYTPDCLFQERYLAIIRTKNEDSAWKKDNKKTHKINRK